LQAVDRIFLKKHLELMIVSQALRDVALIVICYPVIAKI